jgi:acyl-homoserine-lactone acylase
MAPNGQNFRSLNAIKLLNNTDKISLNDLEKIGYDHYLAAFDVLLPALFDAFSNAPDSTKQKLSGPVKLLQQWNRRPATNSVATTIAIEWGTLMLTGMPRAATTEQGTYQTERVAAMTQNTSAQQQLKFLSDALSGLDARFGDWKIQWGDINRFQRSADGRFHDDQPSIAVAQTSSVFGQLPSFVATSQNTKKRYGYSGNSFIASVEFGPKIRARSIISGGESFDPSSKHFTDQAELFIEGKFKDVWFYKEDVMKHIENSYHPGE